MFPALRRAAGALITLAFTAGIAHAQATKNARDHPAKDASGNMEWALFSHFEKICNSFHVVVSGSSAPGLETLFRTAQWQAPYSQWGCLAAHRHALATVPALDTSEFFDRTYKGAVLGCILSKHAGGAEGCEVASRRQAGDMLVLRAITNRACAEMLQSMGEAAGRSGFCISLPIAAGEEERWKPLSRHFFRRRTRKPAGTCSA